MPPTDDALPRQDADGRVAPTAPSGPPAPGAEPDEAPVPDALRALLVRVAAEVLGGTDPVEVPASLRAVRRFAPRRRASAGSGPLWTALREDAAFRARVARVWSAGQEDDAPDPDDAPDDAPAAAPVGLAGAATAWLQGRPWRHLLAPDDGGAGDDRADRPGDDALHRELEHLRAALGVAREDERAAREEVVALRRELRRLRSDADRARSEARGLADRAAADAARAADERRAAEEEATRAQEALRAAAAERAATRDQARTGRELADARVRLLVDTLADAAAGLRAELALPPVTRGPADLVAPAAPAPAARPTSRGRAVDDPALVDDLLRMPRAHLLLDGYNVSKTGWPALPLADQRRVLVDAAAHLAARTGAEVTCCFDGVEGYAAPAPQRGVRVLFTAGETADDLLRRLVAAEPPGRVVVVVTSDREVADDVEARGAWVLPSSVLVARLRRR